MDTLSLIKKHQLIAIIRGAKPTDVMKIAEALYLGGIRLLEITMNSENALETIKQVSSNFDGKLIIGAGTVLDAQTAEAAVEVGAKFILSPGTSKKTIKRTKELGAVSIPGAYTPTEILKAYNAGGDIIKIFPAGHGGAAYIKDVMAPLSGIPMLPTGGINLDNINQFQQIGVVGYGLGSSLVNTTISITDEYLNEIKTTAERFVAAINTNNL